jgi:NAD(P)-dependent dehydrogenase (short-subunit alcohol dehydrogenase family)
LDAFRLDGKVAVVTGGNRGLGRAFAQALSQAGARVAIAARDHGLTAEVAQVLDVLPVDADVTDRGSVEAMLEHVTSELGPVDVLVNNAGTCFHRPASRCRRRSGGRSSTSTSTACGTAPRWSARRWSAAGPASS